MELSDQIAAVLGGRVEAADREDLFRAPLFACSAADDPGYAALKTLVGPWHKSPEELLPGARTVLSFFIPFTPAVVRAVREAGVVAPVWGEAYLRANELLDEIGGAVSGLLRDEGYAAAPIAATHTYDPEKLQSMWSHRSAAALAGLGSFGVNRMLITARGSAGRFGTVLTTAELEPSPAPAPDYCLNHTGGRCLICVDACPAGALKTGEFAPFVCHDRLLANADRLSEIGFCDVCGKCLAACPLAVV